METNQNKEKDFWLPASIIVAALLVTGALVYNTGSKAIDLQQGDRPNPLAGIGGGAGGDTDLSDDDVALGSAGAPVAIVEFGDYQCPFCAHFFSETEPKIREDYIKTGKVKMIFRDFAFLGPESQGAALASQCAAEQGKFWQYHDELYKKEGADGVENNGNLNTDLFKSIASGLGLDRKTFDLCLTTQKYRKEIEKDYDDGVAAGVQGTPASFINGKLVSGAVPYEKLKLEIEAALKSAR